jgi:hypothetical protein
MAGWMRTLTVSITVAIMRHLRRMMDEDLTGSPEVHNLKLTVISVEL